MELELLDGAMGTELRRRGYELRAPLFASHALDDEPDLVAEIHADYLRAGAHIVTTNSFMLGAEGCDPAHTPELAVASVDLARAAIDEVGAPARIAGNLGPHEGVDLRRLAITLVGAGAELLLVETATSLDYCTRALTACAGLGVPVWLSCVWKEGRFLSGEDPRPLAKLDARVRPTLLACNCFELDTLDSNLAALEALANAWGIDKLGVWPNLSRTDDRGFEAVAHDDVTISRALAEAVRAHPRLAVVGSCCGSTPATTSALRRGFS